MAIDKQDKRVIRTNDELVERVQGELQLTSKPSVGDDKGEV